MNRFSLAPYALCALLLAQPAFAQDDRAADRATIKAHIESIFQAQRPMGEPWLAHGFR